MRGHRCRPQAQPRTGSDDPRESRSDENLASGPLEARSRYSCPFLSERTAARADLQGNVPYRDAVSPPQIARESEIRGDWPKKADKQRNFLGSIENTDDPITLTLYEEHGILLRNRNAATHTTPDGRNPRKFPSAPHAGRRTRKD